MTVRRRETGGRVTWIVQVVARRPDGSKYRARRVCTRQDVARRLEAELRAQALTAARSNKEVPTLNDFKIEYLRRCDATNRPQYRRKKEQIIDVQLVPTFGAMRLDEIGVRAIDAYRAERTQHVGAKWVNDCVGVLLHMLSTAQAWELIDRVPKIRPLKVALPEIDYLDGDEQRRLVTAAREVGGPWAAMLVTGLRSGLRLGELRALRWRDVDLVAGRIVVRVAADDKNELQPPKSGKPREVPMGDVLIAELRNHRHLRVHLFDNEDGTLLTVSQCRKALDRITRRAGLRSFGWHCTRHTFASELVMRGATLKAVQELGGWSSLAMVLRYAHLSPDARRDAVRLLDQPGATSGATLVVDDA